MATEDVHDIVIVGGGICGLALSLGLHRKGIKSLILERSQVLRSEGAAIALHGNGWHALDQLKIAADLRNRSIPLTGRHVEYLGKDDKNFIVTYRNETRCLRRKDIIEILARELPAEQMRFGCEVISLDFDQRENLHILNTRNGSVIKAKVLIGCDGSYSVVAQSLQLARPKFVPVWTIRGVTVYPEGHHFENHFLYLYTGKASLGRFPIDNKSIHFFVSSTDAPKGDMTDPEVIKEYTLELLKGSPSEVVDAVRNCSMDTLSFKQAGFRSPWALLHQKYRRGTLAVAGDAMHAMGPFIGQGGSVALEDAVVLTRCLSNAINAETDLSMDEKWVDRVETALDLFVKERRLRLLRVAMQTYLVGLLYYTKSWVAKMPVIFLLIVFFGGYSDDHALFDCGSI